MKKASPGFQDSIFQFCVRMFEEEEFPEEFQNTTLHMIFKGGRGRKEILSDSRFIHCKEFWARTAEGLIVEGGLWAALSRNPLYIKLAASLGIGQKNLYL